MVQSGANQNWWGLHLRVARGERLSEEERSLYDASLRELDNREVLASLSDARQARAELRDLEAERRRLEERRQQLDAEITTLEGALAPQARQLLGAEE